MTLEDLRSELYGLETELGNLRSDKEDIECEIYDVKERWKEVKEAIKEEEEYQKKKDEEYQKELEHRGIEPKKIPRLAYQLQFEITSLTNKLNSLPLHQKKERKKVKEEIWKLKEVIII